MLINLVKRNYHIIILFLSFLSLVLGFYFNEDGHGGGAHGDFHVTFPFIIALQENLLADPKEYTLVHTPLHYYLMAILYFFIKDQLFIRLMFLIISTILAIFFFKSLKINYRNKNSKNLLVITSIIFILPAYRYTTIWPTDLVTSLIFFQISILFYLKWKQSLKYKLDSKVYLQIIFLALATYCRQYFCVFFIYFLIDYYKKLSPKEFIQLFILCVLTSIPVLYYTYLFPELLTEQHVSIYALNYFLLGNSSMIFIYIFPFLILNFYEKNIKLNAKNIKIIITIIFFIIILYLGFDSEKNWLGGGPIYVFSKNIFNNNIIFLISSVLTYFFLYLLCLEDKENISLFLIIIFTFFSYVVFQRYYEPMFFLIIFTLVQSKYINFIINNTRYCIFLFFYYMFYFLGCISNIIHQF